MKRRVIHLAIALLVNIPISQAPSQTTEHNHQSQMNTRGEHIMGFSQEKTTHHFELTYDGGVIDVRANDIKDTEIRDEIRSHFRHISHSFSDGDFTDPMLVHARTSVPGTSVMKQQKDELHWEFMETTRGAKLVVTADNKRALDALHEFLRFQIEDHQTGDCPMIR